MTNKKQKRTTKDQINEPKTKNSEIVNREFNLGDLTWVKIRDSAWWPAQVVDEENVSDKPKKKLKDGILCRLYGTYKYVYVDACKSNSEFEDALKRENKTIKEKFLEVVLEDISLMKSGSKASKSSKKASGTTKKQDSTKGKRKLDSSQDETNPNKKKQKSSSSIKNNEINASKKKKNEGKSGNKEESKAKHIEIRKKVMNILHRETKIEKGTQKKGSNAKLKNIKEKEDLKMPNSKSTVASKLGEERGSISERKIRVMQSLALIAPLGSPFRLK